MMASTYMLALVVLGLSCLQSVLGLAVEVSQISCTRLYFTLTLTAAEIRGAENLGVLIGGDIVSEVGLSGSFTTSDSADFYAAFFDGSDITSGATTVTFALLDADDATLPTFTPVTQTLTFQCGTVITTSARATSTTRVPAATTTSNSNNGGSTNNGGTSSGSDSSSSSSGSSSSTGAIAGGVVGGLAALAIIALIAFCMIRKKKRQNNAGRLRNNDEVDEAAYRAPNNHSNASLATAPETSDTPMMRDVSTKNVFADPTASGTSGAPSGTSGAPSGSSSHLGAASGAAAAGGIGAAAIAARKQSREDSRARSSSLHSDRSPMSEDVPPPVPSMPAARASQASAAPSAPSTTPAAYPSLQNRSAATSSAAPQASTSGPGAAVAAAAAGAAAGEGKGKSSKWGFKRASQDKSAAATSTPVADPAGSTPADTMSLASTTPSYASAGGSESPSRSFNVLQKPPSAPYAMAGPSNKSITPSEASGSRKPFAPAGQKSGFATPPGSTRGNANSRAPSVASMTAGFADAPPMPSNASAISAPVSESGNMAGVGAGRAYNISSGNSTKWHQQSYNIMPNFSARAMPRSTQLEEDLIFGHLGMGLASPTMPSAAGNGSETGSSKSRRDPFGDR